MVFFTFHFSLFTLSIAKLITKVIFISETTKVCILFFQPLKKKKRYSLLLLLYQHHGDRQNGDNLYEAAKGLFGEKLYYAYADKCTDAYGGQHHEI